MNLVLASGYCSMPREWCDNEGKNPFLSCKNKTSIMYLRLSLLVVEFVC